MTRPELPLVALLQRRARWFQEQLMEGLAEAGTPSMTLAHSMVLAHLPDQNTALSIANLARLAGVTRQTMHRAVQQLSQEGLITADGGAGFPRVTLIRITEDGMKRRQVAAGILADLEAELARYLGAELDTALREALTRPWPRQGDAL